MAYQKDVVKLDLDSQQFPKDFHVPMTKIKGDLHFTIDKVDDGAGGAPTANAGGGAKNPLNLSPRAPRRLADQIEKVAEKKEAAPDAASGGDKRAEWRKSVKVRGDVHRSANQTQVDAPLLTLTPRR